MFSPIKLFVTTDTNDSGAPTTSGKAVSGTSTYYSAMWSGLDATSYDLQVSWSGTPTGTLTLQVSDKPNPDETTDTDWVTSTEVTVTNPAGSASGFRVASTGSPAFRKRLKYVNSSGTGTLSGWVIVPRL